MAKFKPTAARTIAVIEAELSVARRSILDGDVGSIRRTLLSHKISLLEDELAQRRAARDALDRAFNSKP